MGRPPMKFPSKPTAQKRFYRSQKNVDKLKLNDGKSIETTNNNFPLFFVQPSISMTMVSQTPAAIQKRYMRDRADAVQDELNKSVRSFFPKKLILMKVENRGKSNSDYGSASDILNFISKNDVTSKIGKLSLGWTYESDKSKITNPGKTRSQVSAQHLEYLQSIMESMCNYDPNLSPQVLMTMQVMPVCGAQTLLHTDTCRGVTANYVIFHHSLGCLAIHWFPRFKSSVVILEGVKYIPKDCDQNYLDMYGVELDGKNCDAAKYRFPVKRLSELQLFGDLNFAVIGVKDHKLQILGLDDQHRVISSPTELVLVTIQHCFDMAARLGTTDKNTKNKIVTKFHMQQRWHKFYGWMYAHQYLGQPLVPRTHVFFRSIRQVTTGCHYITVGEKISMIWNNKKINIFT